MYIDRSSRHNSQSKQRENDGTKKTLRRPSYRGWVRNFAPGVGLPRGFGRIWKSWGSRDTARRSRSVIDFAYDTDWTGLRNWTGFLAGLTSLPSLVAPFAPARCLPSTQSLLLLSISRVLYASGRYIEAYVHTRTRTYTYTYILNVSRSIHPRDEEGFPLVSLAGYVEGDWPRTSDLCDRSSRTYLWTFQARFFQFHITLAAFDVELWRRKCKHLLYKLIVFH